ncbi:hypothetical protein ACET3Z_004769 [Daucus carota]
MNYEEREARSKMTECRKELRNRDSGGDSNEVDTTFSESMRYDVKLYYGGHFVQVPIYSYTSSQFKLYKNIDLENITVNDLKVFFGEIVGEFDSLYFGIDNGRLELLNNASKFEVIEYSRTCNNDASNISSSLLLLRNLQYLDLSGKAFDTPIPSFFGSLANLVHLNLSGSDFQGAIPDELGNLSNLAHLHHCSSKLASV